MNDGFEFNVLYDEDEFVRGLIYAYNRGKSSSYASAAFAVSIIAGLGFVYWYSIREPGPLGPKEVVMGLVALILSPLLAVWFNKFSLATELRLARTFRENSIYQEECFVRIDQNGINSRSSSFETLIRWDAFSEAFESDDDFFFILSENQPLFFPKRAISPQERAALRQIASEQMEERACFLR
jgi:hypothetical protein